MHLHVHHLKCEHLNNQDNQSTVPSVSGLVCVCSKYKLTLLSVLGFAPWSNNIFIALTLPLIAALCSGNNADYCLHNITTAQCNC